MCSKCGIISLKSFFQKRTLNKDVLYNQFKFCRKVYYSETSVKNKEYYLDNRDKISIRHKEYHLKNHDRFNAREKISSNDRYEADVTFRIVCRTRSRVHQALQGKKNFNLKKFRRRFCYLQKMDWVSIYTWYDLAYHRDWSREAYLFCWCI